MTWWHYLLLVNLYLIVFYGFYALLLRNETFFQLNRIYLVSAALLSFLIPVIKADWVKDLFITREVQHTIYATINPEFIYQAKPIHNDPVTLGQILLFIYISGTIILVGRLFYQLLAVKKLIDKMGSSAAFSFFNRIKIDSELPGQQTIIEHEQVHVTQWHSADVLLIEAVMIINWFNPIVYFYRKAIKHVHEFIADKKAIERGTPKAEYAYLLLSQTFGASPHQLTNNFFNKSLLKQRIIMLNKDESKRRKLLKYGLSAPLFACMLILSAATVQNSVAIKIINKRTEQLLMLNTVTIVTPKDSDPQKTTLTVTSSSHGSQMTTVVSSVAVKDSQPAPSAVKEKEQVVVEDNSPVFTAVELNPSFPGGQTAFARFLQANLHYPQAAKDQSIQGRVYVNFVVEKDGSLSNIKVLREPGGGLGDEAARVIASSPKWLPGIQNGSPVKVQYTIPVNFSLNPDLKLMPATDTAKKIFNIVTIGQRVTHARINGVGYDAAEADKTGGVPPVKIMYFRRSNLPPADSVKVIYLVEGKEMTPDQVKQLDPSRIKAINVIKNFTDKQVSDKNTSGIVNILMKDIPKPLE